MWLVAQGERTEPSTPPPEALPVTEETTQVQPAAALQAFAQVHTEVDTPVQAATAGQEAAPLQEATVDAAPEAVPEAAAITSVAAAPNLPTATVALKAGCAIAERAWSRDEGHSAPIDEAFGQLLQTLGSDWSALSRLGDVELWMETADNVLDTLGPQGQQVRSWYDVGYQATLLLNLARRQLELDRPDEAVEARWQGAWVLLRDAAGSAGLAPSALEELHGLLENLRGPARDYTNLGRAQQRVAGLADPSN
jgi:hypothetical protein